MSTTTPKKRKSGTIYDILTELGIKFNLPKPGRPTFPEEARIARNFYWALEDVYQEYRKDNLSKDEAEARTVQKTIEYGPSVWGPDRSNISADCSVQRYWKNGKDEKL